VIHAAVVAIHAAVAAIHAALVSWNQASPVGVDVLFLTNLPGKQHIYIPTGDQTLYSIFNCVILNCA